MQVNFVILYLPNLLNQSCMSLFLKELIKLNTFERESEMKSSSFVLSGKKPSFTENLVNSKSFE